MIILQTGQTMSVYLLQATSLIVVFIVVAFIISMFINYISWKIKLARCRAQERLHNMIRESQRVARKTRQMLKNRKKQIENAVNTSLNQKSDTITQDKQETLPNIMNAALTFSNKNALNNDWVKYTLDQTHLSCARRLYAPSERKLDSVPPDTAHEVCSWICEKRFRGYNGSYIGIYNPTNSTCMCQITDCKSSTAPTCNTRSAVETSTDGVAIPNKEIASAMCPLICIMKHPGKNAEASPTWDGMQIVNGINVPRHGSCLCNIDTCV